MLLKNPIFFGITVVVGVSLQVGISYVSARSILEGDLVLGISLFLLVPVLGILLVLYFFWFRRQNSSKPPN